MSVCFHLLCDQCSTQMWVGQHSSRGGPDSFYLYSDKKKTGIGGVMSKYLMAHRGHPLRLVDSENVPGEYTEIDEETGEPKPPED